jgi:hypothetical protein
LRIIIGDFEIQKHLQGLSLYFATMIIFAIVFLLKVATEYSHTIPINKLETLNLIREMSAVLNNTTTQMHRQHLLVSIDTGVEALIARCRGTIQNLSEINDDHAAANLDHASGTTLQPFGVTSSDIWQGILANSSDTGFDWINFDLLVN